MKKSDWLSPAASRGHMVNGQSSVELLFLPSRTVSTRASKLEVVTPLVVRYVNIAMLVFVTTWIRDVPTYL